MGPASSGTSRKRHGHRKGKVKDYEGLERRRNAWRKRKLTDAASWGIKPKLDLDLD